MRLRSARGRLRYLLLIALVLLVDRLTKAWAIYALAPLGDAALPALTGVVRFRYVLNEGAAFSLMDSAPALVTLMSAIILVPLVCILFFSRTSRPRTLYCVALVFAGGLGNFADRLRFGAVVDFIELLFIRFPVFNAADISVCAGAVLFALNLFVRDKGRRDA